MGATCQRGAVPLLARRLLSVSNCHRRAPGGTLLGELADGGELRSVRRARVIPQLEAWAARKGAWSSEGEGLRRELRALLSQAESAGISRTEIARALGLSKQRISQLMKEET